MANHPDLIHDGPEVPMPYAFTQDVPIDGPFHDRIMDALGPELPDGLVVHLAMELPGGGLRYVDVWESEEDCERFTEERLHPVVHTMLREIFGDALPPEPERTPVTVVGTWIGGASRARR